jgi:hypothetical protein
MLLNAFHIHNNSDAAPARAVEKVQRLQQGATLSHVSEDESVRFTEWSERLLRESMVNVACKSCTDLKGSM